MWDAKGGDGCVSFKVVAVELVASLRSRLATQDGLATGTVAQQSGKQRTRDRGTPCKPTGLQAHLKSQSR